MIKKFTKRAINTSLYQTKKAVAKNPKLKSFVKGAIGSHIVLGQPTNQDLRYAKWVQANYPDGITYKRQTELAKKFEYKPLISIVTPTYNTDPEFLRECIESVQAQTYDNWELCIVDDASPNQEPRDIIKEYADGDKRIRYSFSKNNQHISGASNDGIKMAKGEFIALLDHDDILWPNALYEVVKALNNNKKLDFIYSDEDNITEDRHDFQNPFFKPDWNPDFLHSINYITHFSVLRKSIIEKVGGFREECNGAQDWDLFLRITSETDRIHHIPKVLYDWRISDSSTAKDTSTKPYVVDAQRKALEDDLKRKGYKDATIAPSKINKDYWQIEYPVKNEPLVSIVIPTKDQFAIVKRCIDSIYKRTTYKNFEIVLVDTGSTSRKVKSWYKSLLKKHRNILIVDWPEQPFSYARSCNKGADAATGEYLIMLNNDTEVLVSNWIELMLGYAQREKTGAVGCKLYYPGKKIIQHAGIGIGFGGIAANSLAPLEVSPYNTPLQFIYLNTTHNMTAVTAACLMIKKSVYDEIHGFDEEFRVTYNDVDLCLRLHDLGYRNVYLPHVSLIHHESISVGLPEEKKKRDTQEFKTAKELFKTRWKKYIDHDPNLNPNIDRTNANYEVRDESQK